MKFSMIAIAGAAFAASVEGFSDYEKVGVQLLSVSTIIYILTCAV